MNENRRCSILFHLLVPGGKWRTSMDMSSSLASRCNSRFHSRRREPLLPPPSAVISRRGLGIANTADLLPPTANGLHGKSRRVVVDADVHPARVGGKIINPVRHGAAEFLDQKSCTRTSSGSPCGRHSRPGFLKSPTSSFFFVSTEITGWFSTKAV